MKNSVNYTGKNAKYGRYGSFRKGAAGVLILALAFVLALTGCTNVYLAPQETVVPEIPEITENPTAEPVPTGGVLTLAVLGDPDHFNPLTTDVEDLVFATSLFYEPLIRLNSEMQPEPAICADWSSMDGINWDLTVREDVYFHDGTLLTAEDVVATVQALRSAEGPYSACVENIADLSASGTHVKVRLRAENSLFPWKLFFPVLKAAEVGANRPAGTGRFCLTEAQDDRLIYRTFDNYYGEKANFDGIELRFFDSADEKGVSDCDMILLTGDASVKYGSRLNYTTRMFCDNCLVCMVPYMYTGEKLEYDLGSNQKVEQLPTKRETALKLNMRAAVAALIDRDRVIDRTVSGYGFQYDWPCMDNSVFRKSIGQLSASENLAAVYLGNEGYTHTGGNAYWYKDTDYDKAKPLTVNFVVDSEDVELIHACDAIVSSLKAIGIKTNVKAATGTEYTRLFLSGEYDYGFFRLYTGFCPDLSGMFANGSVFNYNGYDTGNARYAAGRLLKEWRQQGTGDAYAAEFAAMAAVRLENLFEIFKTELPFDGLYMRANCLLISGRVTVGAKTGTQAWDIFDGVQEWYIS